LGNVGGRALPRSLCRCVSKSQKKTEGWFGLNKGESGDSNPEGQFAWKGCTEKKELSRKQKKFEGDASRRQAIGKCDWDTEKSVRRGHGRRKRGK